jgi:beta-lactam-binding protein with PASTA domain
MRTVAPTLVGLEFEQAAKRVRAAWLCVHVRSAHAASVARVIVVSQSPPAGTRLPAYGVMVGRGFRPTTIDVTVAAV